MRPSALTGIAVLTATGIAATHYAQLVWAVRLPLSLLLAAFALATACLAWCRSKTACVAACILLGAVLDTMQWDRFHGLEVPCEEQAYEAVITGKPRHKARSTTMTATIAGDNPIDIQLTTLRDTTLEEGMRLLFLARLQKVKPAWRPFFHYDTWLFHQGISCKAFAFRHKRLNGSTCKPSLRSRLIALLHDGGLEEDAEAVVAAMTLGDKSRITPQLRSTYNEAGGGHLLALSGLHLGIIVAALMLLFGRSYSMRRVRAAVIVPVIWGYVWLTGAPLSLVRAAAMCTVFILSGCVNRHIKGIDRLAFAIFTIIVAFPFWLFDTGFQLSALAVTGLCMASDMPLKVKIRRFRRNVLTHYAADLLQTSITASIATAPLVVYVFHLLPIHGWIMNLLYIPLSTTVVLCSLVLMAFLLMSCPALWLADVLNTLLRWQHTLMLHTVNAVSGLYPSLATVAAAYALLLCMSFRKHIPACLAAATLAISLASDRLVPATPQVFFDDGRAIVVLSRTVTHTLPMPDTTFCRNGFYACPPFAILRIDNDAWRSAKRPSPYPITHLWICRGYSGCMAELLQAVHPQTVILDSTLSPSRIAALQQECTGLHIDCRLAGAD